MCCWNYQEAAWRHEHQGAYLGEGGRRYNPSQAQSEKYLNKDTFEPTNLQYLQISSMSRMKNTLLAEVQL